MTSLAALQRMEIDPDSIGLVVISHLHGDHFGGVPLLLLHRAFGSRSETALTIAGPPGLEARLKALVEEIYPKAWGVGWNFPLHLVELDLEREHELQGRTFVTYPVKHYAGEAPSTALRVSTSAKTIAFSGDTGWTDTLFDVARNADLFICECNFFAKTAFDGHLSYEELLKRRSAFGCKRMILTHLGPDMVGRDGKLEFEVAHDGMIIAV
jgi:ribonuclease BN (tRNA processing enzyme)